MKAKLIALGIIFLCIGLFDSVVGFSTVKKDENNLSKSFINDPFYNKLKPGDIIIYLPGRSVQYGHCRLFKGYTPFTRKYMIIESFYHVIKYKCRLFGLMFPYHLFRYDGIVIVRVNATAEQKQNAIKFAENQVGKRFDFDHDKENKNFDPKDPNDPNANKWYCSELVWAAYYNQGIDIDYNGWEKDIQDKKGNNYSFVSPLDIIADDDVQVMKIWERKHIFKNKNVAVESRFMSLFQFIGFV
jgi:hypothetical protein